MNPIRWLWQKARSNEALRERLRIIIFQSDTPAGKAFDVALLWCIVASILSDKQYKRMLASLNRLADELVVTTFASSRFSRCSSASGRLVDSRYHARVISSHGMSIIRFASQFSR